MADDQQPSGASDAPADPEDGGAPWVVRFASTMLWIVASFSFLVAAVRTGYWVDMTLFVFLGGWSAHLAMAVTRGDRLAWKACRWIALWSAIVNGIGVGVLTVVVVVSPIERWRTLIDEPATKLPLFLGWAVLIVLAPMAVYLALSRPSVRRWYGEAA